MDEFKKVKCKVYRADDAEDQSDIYVCCNVYEASIKVGEEVSLPKPAYDVLVNATYPATVTEDTDGQMKSKIVDRPRFSVIVSGIETGGEANERVSQLAMKTAKDNDALRKENEELKNMLEEQKKNAVIPK